MRFLATALLALLLVACSHGGASLPSAPGWTALYSLGIGRCDDFDFGELHYCVKQMPAQIGQTVRMTFTLSGTGTLYSVDPSDIQPATITLFVAADPSGYSGTRWWCPASKTNLTALGTFTLSCTISSAWTSVGGGMPDPGPPSNIRYVGFTMGGGYFNGHGVAANGQVHFTLNSYTVGAAQHKRKHR